MRTSASHNVLLHFSPASGVTFLVSPPARVVTYWLGPRAEWGVSWPSFGANRHLQAVGMPYARGGSKTFYEDSESPLSDGPFPGLPFPRRLRHAPAHPPAQSAFSRSVESECGIAVLQLGLYFPREAALCRERLPATGGPQESRPGV